LAGIAGGAIVEAGDAQLLVPNVLQPVYFVSGPIDVVFDLPTGAVAAVVRQDAILVSQNRTSTGAAAAGTTNIMTFGKGVWALEVSFDYAFTGTTNVNALDSLQIVDPAANIARLVNGPRITGQTKVWSQTYNFAFQRDSFILQLATTATVAGDALSMNASVHARKIM
jgi:hypothetical protein